MHPRQKSIHASFRREAVVVLVVASILGITIAASPRQDAIDQRIEAMSADERIGQLLIVGFDGTSMNAALHAQVADRRVGGVVFYASNLASAAQVKKLTAAIAESAGPVLPFIAVDQEGGIVHRLQSGLPVLPGNMALGATRSPELARRAGLAVGQGLRQLGFTMNFAPVLDVLPEGVPAAIDTRAFGDDHALVATLGAAFIEGETAGGVVSVGKHFPGQGGAIEDTHQAIASLASSREALLGRDAVPFRRAFSAGLRAVMTSHVVLPNITLNASLPATLSPSIMTDLLRGELRFDGVAITDALQMKAASSSRPASDVALDALLAGCDMVLALGGPTQRDAVFHRLRSAYRDGTLPEERVHASLRRILLLKSRMPAPSAHGNPDLQIEDEIARRAVTLAGDRTLLATLRGRPVVYSGPAGALEHELHCATSIVLPPRLDPNDYTRIKSALLAALRAAPGWIAAAQNESQWGLIEEVHAIRPDLPMIFVNLSTPYRMITAPKAVTVLTYSASQPSQSAAAAVVQGHAAATGTLPVHILRRGE
jgi:beta-N-acetylhexosaminidase